MAPQGPPQGGEVPVDNEGEIWEVVGGADRGGIVVRAAQDLGSAVQPTRLSTGAFVLQLAVVGERLHYGLLEGSGPETGWVSTKLKDKELVVRTGNFLPPLEEGPEEPPPEPKGASGKRPKAGVKAGARGAGPRSAEVPQWEPEYRDELPMPPAQPVPRLITNGVRWVGSAGSGGGKYKTMPKEELEELCQQREIDMAQLESRGHAATLLEMLDKLPRMRVPELKNEVKKRGMATTVGSLQCDLVDVLKQAFLWEQLSLKDLQKVCKEKQLPVAGDEGKEDLLQMLAYSSWEARGVPVWRFHSDTVGHGILDQLDRLERQGIEELAALCEKKQLPLEEEDVSKEMLIGRIRTAIVWEQLPVPELRRECELFVPPEELDELVGKEADPHPGMGAAWRPRVFGQASPEAVQKEALYNRLIEQMWVEWEEYWRIQQFYEMLELKPDTATIAELKKAYKKLALRHHPDKSAGEGEEEQRTKEFQLLSEAYETLQAHIRAMSGEVDGEDDEEEDDLPHTAIFLARHAERRDDAELARGRIWVRGAERPWDPPLSERGHLQAMALGKALAQQVEKLKLPPVTRIFTSPFLRCVETAAEACRQLQVASVCVEPSLCESFCESFYRAWCVPGANGDWGGPPKCGVGVDVPIERIKGEAKGPASDLLHPVWLKHAKGATGRIDTNYEPFLPLSALTFCWGDCETEEQYAARLRAFFDFTVQAFPGESAVFISHAGPLKQLFAGLRPDLPSQMPGYCALYALHRSQRGTSGEAAQWSAPLVADVEHMRRWDRSHGPYDRGHGSNPDRGRGRPPPGVHMP